MRSKAAQSTVEYLLVFALIITVILVLVRGSLKSNVETVYNAAVNRVDYPADATKNMMTRP